MGVEVGCDYGYPRMTAPLCGFVGSHGDGVGFLAGGGGCAPNSDVTALLAEVFGQEGEMVFFAKEKCQIGGQRVNKKLKLGSPCG